MKYLVHLLQGVNLVYCLHWLGNEFSSDHAWTSEDCYDEGSRGNLRTSEQIKFCKKYKHMMPLLTESIKQIKDECQETFADRRWNCNRINRIRHGNIPAELEKDTRESAFVHALSSASLAFRYAEWCFQNRDCSCGRRGAEWNRRYPKTRINFHPCTNYLQKGMEFSKDFAQASYKREYVSSEKMKKRIKVILHNHDIGRQVIHQNQIIRCICAGHSTSCQKSICYRINPYFKDVTKDLFSRYKLAKKLPNYEGKTIRNVALRDQHSISSQSKVTPLYYLEESPNYCDGDSKLGINGTTGRHCVQNNTRTDDCKLMCCGRGFHVHVYTKPIKCNCKFVYCCRLDCQKCNIIQTDFICK